MNQKLTPLAGILFFAMLLGSALTSGNQDGKTSGAKVITYATAHHDKLVASMILTIIAVVIGVIYFGGLRDYLRQGEGVRGLTATAFGGVILFAASGALSAGALLALTSDTSHLDPSTAQGLNLLLTDAGAGLALCGMAILLFTYGMAIVKTGLLPKWLGWIALPFAVVALIPWIGWISFIMTGFWVLFTSIALYRRQAKAAAGSGDAPAPAAAA